MEELDGLINGVSWAIQNQRTSLIVEGDSMVKINLANRIMHGVTINHVSRNWRWEGRLLALRERLRSTPALGFSHIKRSGNKVADILVNEGVGKASSFHAEGHVAKMDNRLWEKCKKVAAGKDGGANPDHPLRQGRGEIIKSPTSPHTNLPLAPGSPISSGSLSKIHVTRHA